ncbi:MAG: DUF4431 domain-containing protein [Hyphomicrobiales bacterium]|nr:DUF4431 domain-containing protein [Hyphomicrobiales bacterium]
MRRYWTCAVITALLFAAPAAAADGCMQANADDETAEGRLDIGQFQDAAGRPESAYVLSLPVPICLDDPDPEFRVETADTIHLYSSNEAVHAEIDRFVGKTVLVRGSPFGAHTVHHHAPIVMDITEIDEQ